MLKVEEVHQRYPGVHALKGVSLSVEPGRVLGLVGENGAGKSTLIRILAGIEQPESGRVRFKGEDVSFSSPVDSQAAGISVVSQEFRLVPQLSVEDNLFLNQEITKGGVIRRGQTRARTKELLSMLGVSVDPRQYVSDLSVADQQQVEIARALSRDFDLLIMDEPTAALSAPEVRNLIRIVRRLADAGKSVIYVSHHLEEVFEVCDDLVVFRDGRCVWSGPASEQNEASLVELMLGRKPESFTRAQLEVAKSDEAALFEVDDVRIPGLAAPFSLSVKAGEVVGLAGLAGSGRANVTRALFGDLPTQGGSVRVNDKRADISNPRSALRSGIFLLNEDRKQDGLLPHLDVAENALIARQSKWRTGLRKYLTLPRADLSDFDRMKQQMTIRVPHGRVLIGNLSGGNQQKVLLGRAMYTKCPVLFLNEPTRGVDVGAKVEIYELIEEMAAGGAAIVVASSDIPELVAITRRCLVLFGGEVVAELTGSQVTEDNITAASLGQWSEEKIA